MCPVYLLKLYLLSRSDWDQDSSSSSTLITAAFSSVDSPAAGCDQSRETIKLRERGSRSTGNRTRRKTVLYSPSPVWHLVRSLRTELRLHTAESPGWALWTAPPHLEEGSHNDLDHLQEGGCSNHKTTAVYFFNALVDTVVSGPLISVQQLILTTKLCSLVYTHST